MPSQQPIHRSLIVIATIVTLLLSACGLPGTANIPTPQPSASASATPVAPTPTAAQPTPAATDQAAQLHYFWPVAIPDGMIVDAARSQANEDGFTLELIDPADAQRTITLHGGRATPAAARPPAIGTKPITVRGQDGGAFTTGAGFSIHWDENGEPYSLGGFFSSDDLIAIAESFEPLDLQAWNERLDTIGSEASASPQAAAQCDPSPDLGMASVVLGSGFCVQWVDGFNGEAGFWIELSYTNGEQFRYEVGPDVTTFIVPESDQPQANCPARSSFTITVISRFTHEAGPVGSMVGDSACDAFPAPSGSDTTTALPPMEQDRMRICVAAADGPLKPGVFDTIRANLINEVSRHPDYAVMNQNVFNGNEPEVVEGCPGPMTILDPQWDAAGSKGGAAYRVETPSPYLLFVWIVGEDEAVQAFGDQFPRRTGQEMMCEGHNCGTINSAVYITPAELEDAERLAQSLSWGIGLDPARWPAPSSDAAIDPQLAALQSDLENLIAGWSGKHAVSVTDLQSGATISVNGDRPQLAACTLKIALMIAVAQDIEAGLYTADDVAALVQATMGPSYTPPARDLIARIGGGDVGAGIRRINDLLRQYGASDSIITHPPGYPDEEYGYLASHGTNENRLTTDDLNRVLAALYHGDGMSEWARSYVLDSMAIAPDWMDAPIRASIPADARLYHKIGQLYEPENVWNDAVIVQWERNGQQRAFAISYLGSYGAGWQEAYAHETELAGRVWEHFNRAEV